MRVAYLITLAERGGAQVHVADLLRGFHTKLDLSLVTGETGFLTDVANALGIPHRILPDLVHPIRPGKDARAIVRMVRILRELRPDVVHCHTSKAGFVGRVAAGFLSIPVVFTAHTWCFTEGTSWKWQLLGTPTERLVATWTKTIITVSEANRRLALDRGIAQPSRVCTIHNGIPDTDLRAQPDRPGVIRITMVARCAPPKDQPLLVRALSGINVMPWRLDLVGDGPTRPEVQAEIERLGVGDRVTLLGTRSEIPEFLAEAHVLALVSSYEGFPLSVLEGMRAGLPVIASRVGGVIEAVVHEETGLLVPQGDEESLRSALFRLISDPKLRLRFGNAGRRRFEKHFTLEQMLDRTYQVYARVAGGDVPALSFYKVDEHYEVDEHHRADAHTNGL
jgi:glycosyltransferase involved in cell wall biosynthesis